MKIGFSEIIAIISALSCIVAIAYAFKNGKRTNNQDIVKDAEYKAESKLMLVQISNDMKDVKTSVSNITTEVKELRDKVVCVEQSSKSAHKRIDDIVAVQKGNVE